MPWRKEEVSDIVLNSLKLLVLFVGTGMIEGGSLLTSVLLISI